ncbi:MAG: AsmA family protein [Sedimentisphaerales bacterium]|nr:AsmA family protein [Sedimentisphaerales bacterium]
MKGLRKSLSIVLGTIIVLFIAAMVLLHLYGNNLLKTGIEAAVSKTLKVGVRIDDMDLSILGAEVGFRGLEIDNPPGYNHKQLLDVDDARIAVTTGSLMKDTVNIKEITLDNVKVVLEQKGVTSNNIQDVIQGIPRKKSASQDEKKKGGKKLHIDKLELKNITVNAKLLPVPGKADTVTLKLDPIVMTDLGSDNKLDMAELTTKILFAIATGVTKQGVGILPESVTKTLSTTLGITADLGKAAAEGGVKILEEGANVGKDMIKGVEDLLKPKKKEEK